VQSKPRVLQGSSGASLHVCISGAVPPRPAAAVRAQQQCQCRAGGKAKNWHRALAFFPWVPSYCSRINWVMTAFDEMPMHHTCSYFRNALALLILPAVTGCFIRFLQLCFFLKLSKVPALQAAPGRGRCSVLRRQWGSVLRGQHSPLAAGFPCGLLRTPCVTREHTLQSCWAQCPLTWASFAEGPALPPSPAAVLRVTADSRHSASISCTTHPGSHNARCSA